MNKSGGVEDAFDDVEYVERSYHEALVNALAHRDYLVNGSEEKNPTFRSDRYRFTVVMPNLNYGENNFDIHLVKGR